MVKPQIFGLHFSGGNIYSLQNLFTKLKSSFDVELLELPGRGKRTIEPLLYTREEAVADLLQQIRRLRKNVPYFIYGHSMGAELGFIITKELELLNDPATCFIPTGNAGPNIHKREKLADLPDHEFFDKLKELGGISELVLQDKELMELFGPILRADFGLLENAEETLIDYKINTPVYAIMGSEENYTIEIENWKKYTTGNFEFKIMPGNHFFIHQHTDAITQIISDSANKWLASQEKIPTF